MGGAHRRYGRSVGVAGGDPTSWIRRVVSWDADWRHRSASRSSWRRTRTVVGVDQATRDSRGACRVRHVRVRGCPHVSRGGRDGRVLGVDDDRRCARPLNEQDSVRSFGEQRSISVTCDAGEDGDHAWCEGNRHDDALRENPRLPGWQFSSGPFSRTRQPGHTNGVGKWPSHRRDQKSKSEHRRIPRAHRPRMCTGTPPKSAPRELAATRH